MRRNVSRPAALLSAGLLLFGSVGAATAASPKSFDASFCLFVGGNLQATVTWSGYRVDAVVGGQNDHYYYREYVVPVDPPARQGTVTVEIPYDDAAPYVTAEIRLGSHAWRSVEVESTGLDFPNLPRC